jgi:hypothetical protein
MAIGGIGPFLETRKPRFGGRNYWATGFFVQNDLISEIAKQFPLIAQSGNRQTTKTPIHETETDMFVRPRSALHAD